MKIYEIGTGYTPIPAQMGAATEIVVEELTRAIQKSGNDVQILDIQTENRKENNLPIREVPIPKCFRGTDVQLGILHKLKRVVYSVSLARELRKLLQSETEPVLLHFHNQYNLFFFLRLVSPRVRAKTKIAYTVHSYIWPGAWEDIKQTVRKRYFQEVFCVQNADYVLLLNDQTAENFVKHLGVDHRKIFKIGNGVNTDVYHIMEREEREALKVRIGLSGRQVILQVGSVCDRKNQLGAIQSLKTLLEKRSDLVYIYAGGVIDEEYQQQIRRYAAERGLADRIIYAGELSPGQELNQYYNVADVTVFPSKVESFGLVIIESIAAGTPVVLTDKPLFDLNCGWKVCENLPDLANQVERLLQNPEKELSGRFEVTKNYGWDKIAEDHLKIWNGCQ